MPPAPTEADRPDFANDAGADLVVSLHLDRAPSPHANGVAAYYYGNRLTGSYSAQGERLADLLHRGDRPAADLLDCIHGKTLDLLAGPGVRGTPGAAATSPHSGDQARLADPSFRDVLAEAVVAGIRRYLPTDVDPPTGEIRLADVAALLATRADEPEVRVRVVPVRSSRPARGEYTCRVRGRTSPRAKAARRRARPNAASARVPPGGAPVEDPIWHGRASRPRSARSYLSEEVTVGGPLPRHPAPAASNPYVTRMPARTGGMTASQVRALFAVASRPEVVRSPAVCRSCPRCRSTRSPTTVARLIRDRGAVALQYGSGQGDATLREQILEASAPVGVRAHPDDIVVTAGSQMALDLVVRGVLRPRRRRARRGAHLRRALGVFSAYQCQVVHVADGRRGAAAGRAARGDRGRRPPGPHPSSSTRSRRSTTRPASRRGRRVAREVLERRARPACCCSRTTPTACSASTAPCRARSAPTTPRASSTSAPSPRPSRPGCGSAGR